ncbi:hypothetical protein [Pseudarthrobacter sp. TAF60_1]|uniref:hypothetical protein n=1 Tax=Pseudarthrobacter sp. TAF60_1 TaxID=3233071 RepID=UPI003F9AB7DD
MPAINGAPLRRQAALSPGPDPPRKVSLRSRPWTVVVLSTAAALLTSAVSAGCEYNYNDGWRPPLNDIAAATTSPQPDFSADQWQNDPVGAAGLEAWVETVQLGSGLQVAHRGYGLLRAGEIRSEVTAGLPAGRYVLALACRSKKAVAFSVTNEAYGLVHLSLLCGSTRRNVIYLSQETVLTFRVEAESAANYAYRLIWL